jgi:hypothetical protein
LISVTVKDLLSITRPSRGPPAISGYGDFFSFSGKSLDVDLIFSRFIGSVSNVLSIRRKDRILFVKGSCREGGRGFLAIQVQDPDVRIMLGWIVTIQSEELAIW